MRFTKRRTGCLRELKKFMSPRATRSTGHLQAGDLARHFWRHLGVGQHLIEQGGDDVDDHLVQRGPATGTHQFLAVGADLVDGHQRAGKAGHVQAGVVMGASATQTGRGHRLFADFARLTADLPEQILGNQTDGCSGGQPSATAATPPPPALPPLVA